MIGMMKRIALRQLFASRMFRRRFSVKATYSSCPATLLHYSPHQKLGLYNEKEADNRPDDIYNDRVSLKDGLVLPSISQNSSTSNGAAMYPNTCMLQELFRQHYDDNLDREDDGQEVDTPYIYSIPKGTPIPSHLILTNEWVSHFSLQPARGMPIRALNGVLEEFYSKHAQQETADAWFDKYPYHLANDDHIDAKWMSE
ncbi:hypothetical protein E0Z10_g2881 [Xylaria hypoxylon]|uniref:Tse2 ADP-ribosyltransferase toxin domain-containing protein n=1 Tax=Xylaria hypoxylon TaxID=37992 RepID=A0A4Z0ZB75_9PEZI|nr:hypothetical protein E0Z10_g2881 [Xylaria hypoxylon]